MLWAIAGLTFLILFYIASKIAHMPDPPLMRSKPKREPPPEPPKDWQGIVDRLEKRVGGLEAKLSEAEKVIRQKDKEINEKETEISNIKQQYLQEQTWRKKEEDTVSKEKKREKLMEDELAKAREGLNSESTQRIKLEYEVKELRAQKESVAADARRFSSLNMEQERKIKVLSEENRTFKRENEELKVKKEADQWVAKDDYIRIEKLLKRSRWEVDLFKRKFAADLWPRELQMKPTRAPKDEPDYGSAPVAPSAGETAVKRSAPPPAQPAAPVTKSTMPPSASAPMPRPQSTPPEVVLPKTMAPSASVTPAGPAPVAVPPPTPATVGQAPADSSSAPAVDLRAALEGGIDNTQSTQPTTPTPTEQPQPQPASPEGSTPTSTSAASVTPAGSAPAAVSPPTSSKVGQSAANSSSAPAVDLRAALEGGIDNTQSTQPTTPTPTEQPQPQPASPEGSTPTSTSAASATPAGSAPAAVPTPIPATVGQAPADSSSSPAVDLRAALEGGIDNTQSTQPTTPTPTEQPQPQPASPEASTPASTPAVSATPSGSAPVAPVENVEKDQPISREDKTVGPSQGT